MFNKENKIYCLQVIIATLLWGAAYPFTKHVVSLISPLTLVFIRSIAGSLLFILFVKIDYKRYLKPDLLFKIFIISILGVSLQQYSQCYALKYTKSTNAGFIIALTPIIVVLIELILGSKISKDKILGFLFGMFGCIIIMYSVGKFNIALPSTKGDLIFLSSSFTWALYVILTKRWFNGYSSTEVTAITMIVAFITLIPFNFNTEIIYVFRKLDFLGYISIAYLSFLSSFVGYLFWNNAVNKIGPVKSSYFIYDEPFATMLSAYFILNEVVLPLTFLGGLLILIGVYFILKEQSRLSYAQV